MMKTFTFAKMLKYFVGYSAISLSSLFSNCNYAVLGSYSPSANKTKKAFIPWSEMVRIQSFSETALNWGHTIECSVKTEHLTKHSKKY